MPSLPVWLTIALAVSVLGALGLRRLRPRRPLSAAEFTVEFAKRLRLTTPRLRVQIEAEKQLRISGAKGETLPAFLDNAYTQYLQDPGALPDLLHRFCQSFTEMSQEGNAPLERSRIVPIVKDRKWITEIRESLKARVADQPPEVVFDGLNDELIVVYAADTPNSVRYFKSEMLKDIGVAREELRSLAVENLKRLFPTIQIVPGELFSMVKADGNYEASLLLLDDLWSGGQIKVDGDYVVAIPARGLLLVTGSRNLPGVAKLRELAAQEARQSPYHLTADLFVNRNGSFQRLPPE